MNNKPRSIHDLITITCGQIILMTVRLISIDMG